MSAESVLAGYRTRLHRLSTAIERARAAQSLSFSALLAALGLFVVLFAAAGQRRAPLWTLAVPGPVLAVAGLRYAASRARWLRAIRLRDFYDRGVARLEDRWSGSGSGGEEFRPADHVYDCDLNILGEGSVFELLCTARTGVGRRRLAQYLLEPCDLSAARARQEAVRELAPLGELRERIALLGKHAFQQSSWETFAEWLDTPPATAPDWVRALAFASSALLAAIVLAGLATSIPWAALAPAVPVSLAIDAAIAWRHRKRTELPIAAARRVGVEIGAMREGIELISTLTFGAASLRSIQQCLGEGDAAAALRVLERLTAALGECDKPYFDLPSQALIVRTQLCFAIENWKRLHAGDLHRWLDAWGEFEALAAVACYASEHPDDAFPQFDDGPPAFLATALGHPLIPAAACVRNDVALDARNRFYVVSGSNMSGKSTLLRSIGLAAVLAKAGAPVRAAALRLSDVRVFASLSIIDSLPDGKSRFLAEVERIRRTLEGARGGPALFLIDEILSGTNSRDRRIAAESIVRELIQDGAIGALSTHDLALTEIAEIAGLAGANVHMGSRTGEDPMDFDYLLKPGVTREANALAIVAMVTRREGAVRARSRFL